MNAERIIGVNISFLTDERKKQIENNAKQFGFIPRFFSEENEPGMENTSDCEVLFGMFSTSILKNAKNLKWMHCSFAGVDRYTDESIYPSSEVILTNSSGAYGITISEHIICTLLMMMRRMPEYSKLTDARGWRIIGDIKSIYGSTITVVGVGDIGSCFGMRAKAMGATIKGVRRASSEKPDWCDEIYTTDNLKVAVANSDAVILCVPATKDTESMINAEIISAMKDGAYIVNVGRGSAVDQEALSAALKCGKLAGAALDVTVPEPLPIDHFLWETPNILITPHVSGNMSLEKTCEIAMEIFISNLEKYACGKQLDKIVDRKAGY